ncbi:hypothetical protein P368_08880 [Comamonas thiooxydans]|nr:hypothetical protein P369_12025 [Comamonas thiooxydans]KGG97195.1 hypothetical protein P367_17235 [Comamonas thiooxydans]KGH05718.1 hypothetical protein P365_09230 [Comamonas thiooxydans]KGH13584.1 hypothetical protein P368_08880 [Comamonas thiooxydans]
MSETIDEKAQAAPVFIFLIIVYTSLQILVLRMAGQH